MPLKSRRNLSCFYCGSRYAHQWDGTSRSFQCRHCEAPNHLDQKGSITDPPAQASPIPSRPTRFAKPARSPPRSAQSSFGAPEPPPLSPIFCDQCLSNQNFARGILADYLPSENSRDYQQCLNNLDRYKQDLYKRYPQICVQCAPRAREQLRLSAKVARSDHLQRLIDRTKRYGPWAKDSGSLWKSLLIRLGGFAWWASLMLSICWHAVTVTTANHAELGFDEDSLNGNGRLGMMSSCARHVYQRKEFPPSCAPNFAAWMPLVIMIAMLSGWWHPRMRDMHQRPSGRYAGRLQFYALQLFSVGLRWFAWNRLGLSETGFDGFRSKSWKAMHGLIAVCLVLITWTSHKIIRIEHSPPVNFNLSPKDLLSDVPKPQWTGTTPRPNAAQKQRQPPPSFPIANLSSNHRLPTPPPEEDYHCAAPPIPDMGHANPQTYKDPDAMDWSPSGPATRAYLNPQRRPGAVSSPPLVSSTSPFHGTLPAAPQAPSYRLRNPNAYNPSVFRKATEAQKKNTFGQQQSEDPTPSQKRGPGRPRKETSLHDAVDDDESDQDSIATEMDDRRQDTPYNSRQSRSTKKRDLGMQQPSFWPQQDNAETGLEDLFGGGSFRLEERESPTEAAGNRWGRLFGYG